ncbi:hypothetical protein HDU96_007765 [Phlyctochytrium bullatum]|nr:hypothetical protein HDU96_007765 [Phlyctochytrium bullatum]
MVNSKSRTVYIGNLSQDAREHDVDDLFRVFGNVKRITLKNGFGFLEYSTTEEAAKACQELHGFSFLGERLRVTFSEKETSDIPLSGHTAHSKYGPPERTNFRCIAENLPDDTTWQELKDFMRKADGDVVYTTVLGRGVGLVEFATLEDLRTTIVTLGGTKFQGRIISLQEVSSYQSPLPLQTNPSH